MVRLSRFDECNFGVATSVTASDALSSSNVRYFKFILSFRSLLSLTYGSLAVKSARRKAVKL